jgi:hypothetical protein
MPLKTRLPSISCRFGGAAAMLAVSASKTHICKYQNSSSGRLSTNRHGGKPPVPAVAQMVGFGLEGSKVLYLLKGFD